MTDYEQCTVWSNGGLGYGFAMTFTPQITHTCKKLTLLLNAGGGAHAGDVTIQLVTGVTPNGTVIATFPFSWSGGGWQVVATEISPGVSLSAYQMYGICCDNPAGWAYGDNSYNAYSHGGQEFYKPGGSWIALGTNIYFIESGDAGPAGWSNIAKVDGISAANLAKVNGISVANIAKVNGVSV